MAGVVLAVKQTNRPSVTDGKSACCPQMPNLATLPIPNNVRSNAAPAATLTAPANAPAVAQPLPRLVDLGAGKCIPCKMMAPILEELKKEYAGRMNVEFIDVWVNPDAGKPYSIEMIPTQIFFDASGKELFRHTGFFGKEDILAKWKELGVELK
jgi:thioredoxin 1